MSSKALKRKRPVDAADEAPRKVENNEEKSQLAEIEAAIAICGDKVGRTGITGL